MPIKYTDELKQRAVELVLHAQANPDTAHGAVRRVADELGVSKEALRSITGLLPSCAVYRQWKESK